MYVCMTYYCMHDQSLKHCTVDALDMADVRNVSILLPVDELLLALAIDITIYA